MVTLGRMDVGDYNHGGDLCWLWKHFLMVEKIMWIDYAFAVVLKDGTVVIEIDQNYFGISTITKQAFLTLNATCWTHCALAVIIKDRTGIICRDKDYGGYSDGVKDNLVEDDKIYFAAFAFATILKYWTMVWWCGMEDGADWYGSNSSHLQMQILMADKICSIGDAFAATIKDGHYSTGKTLRKIFINTVLRGVDKTHLTFYILCMCGSLDGLECGLAE